MSELILELYSEEIPALMQKKAEEAYLEIFTKILQVNALSYDDLEVLSAPTRIAIRITGLLPFVVTQNIEVKGPKVDAPQAAIEGFCRTHNINISELNTKLLGEQLFYFYSRFVGQKTNSDILLKIIPQAIGSIKWSKTMRWGSYNLAWIRPLKNIMCMYDNSVLPIKFAHLTANNITFGHKFISPDAIYVNSWNDYVEQLEKNYVILSRSKRRAMIEQQLELLTDQFKIKIKYDEKLMDEVIGLIEYPCSMVGEIPTKFLNLPPEVLITAMRTHQKYFSTSDRNGEFAPYFLFVSNNPSNNSSSIIAGNEQVLNARLSDALYFYNKDLELSLNLMTHKLDQVVFHAKLGTLTDKLLRVEKLCVVLFPSSQQAHIAAKLYKSDLVSEVVKEFPELQGIIGGYYAVSAGYDKDIATAIQEHYKPLGPHDNVPYGAAAILALMDKIDSLISLYCANELPSSSSDPYALRRTALGIIRIILENKLQFNFKTYLDQIIVLYQNFFNDNKTSAIVNSDIEKNIKKAWLFIEERAKFHFKNSYDISLINAVLDLGNEGDLVLIKLKLEALKAFLDTDKGDKLLNIYKRVNNILSGKSSQGSINSELFVEDAEKELFHKFTEISHEVTKTLAAKNFIATFNSLENLYDYIANFFDNIMVNVDDATITNNRILLLKEIENLFTKIAKFSQL